MRDIRILPTSDAEQFTAALFQMFEQSTLAVRAIEFDTCRVCGVSLPVGEEFDEHCCCGRGKGTHPDCQRCNL